VSDQSSGHLPAGGTFAARSLPGEFGTSRWQLRHHATSLVGPLKGIRATDRDPRCRLLTDRCPESILARFSTRGKLGRAAPAVRRSTIKISALLFQRSRRSQLPRSCSRRISSTLEHRQAASVLQGVHFADPPGGLGRRLCRNYLSDRRRRRKLESAAKPDKELRSVHFMNTLTG
jgi:hypothetical protein